MQGGASNLAHFETFIKYTLYKKLLCTKDMWLQGVKVK